MKPNWTRRTAVVVALLAPTLHLACSAKRPPGSGSTVEEVPVGGSTSTSSSSGTYSSPTKVCDGNLTLCANGCVDLSTAAKHCGECGRACNADQGCVSGKCAALDCRKGLTACEGQCRDFTSDPTSCGRCGKACQGDERCIQGVCGLLCPAGAVICAGRCVEPNSDPSHCGATPGCGEGRGSAGVVCGGGSCLGGQCVADCPDGKDMCPSGCVDFANDDANCGSCGLACGSGRHCSARVCCPVGQSACMGVCRDTTSDPTSCGGCGIACNAGERCVGGACTP
ncbi:MAG: hypothetical protein JST00_31865 [Deltaproteobacteria bacterium]|nr:hypothetical protein [Deltaproteobacteria bacterium]